MKLKCSVSYQPNELLCNTASGLYVSTDVGGSSKALKVAYHSVLSRMLVAENAALLMNLHIV